MPQLHIPRLSIWQVSTRDHFGLMCSTEPGRIVGLRSSLEPSVVLLQNGTVVTTGDEVFQNFFGSTHHFVEILMPRRCWVNRVLFNEGLNYLKRIA